MPSDSIPLSIEDSRIQRTTRMAIFFPGSGQCMNRKYWKAPLVWGGMAYCVSAIRFNNVQLSASRTELIDLELTEPSTVANYDDDLQAARNEELFYRRQRDLSWFALGLVHLIGVLDAHVDANLASFDVGDDLAWEFGIIPLDGPQPSVPGLSIHWDLNTRKMTKFAR